MRAHFLSALVCLAALVFAALVAPAAPARAQAPQPRYFDAIRNELRAMHIEAQCDSQGSVRAHCVFRQHGASSNRDFTIHLVYSDESDTIYFFVEHYLSVPANGPNAAAQLRRLMELNWELLLGKLEWNSADGEVRLAMIMNTDSNFDRRSFRSVVRGIAQVADRYAIELGRSAGH